MADDETSEGLHDTAEPERPIAPVFDVYSRPEQNLVEIAMMASFIGFPLTLYMPWGIVSGHAASPNEYYAHLAARARSGISDPNLPEGWGKILDQWAEANFDAYADMDPAERTEKSYYDGVNLTSQLIVKDAKCWTSGFDKPIEHDFLRVRISDVSAWAWGALQ